MKPSERVLCSMRAKCRFAENLLQSSLRRFRNLVPEALEIDITPDADLTYSSLEEELSATQAPDQRAGQTPSRRKTRLPSNASTVPVWSGEEGNQMGPLDTLVEEQLSADDSELNLSSVSRQQRQKTAGGFKQEPFYIYNEFAKLRTRVEHYQSETCVLVEAVSDEEPLAIRVQGKINHYLDVFDQLEEAMNKLLWNVCQGNQQPLPGSPSRWKTRLEYQKVVPPIDASTPIPDPVQEQPVLTTQPGVTQSAPLLDTSVPQVVAAVPVVSVFSIPAVSGINPSSPGQTLPQEQVSVPSSAQEDQHSREQTIQQTQTRPRIVQTGFRVCNNQHSFGTAATNVQAGGPAQTITVTAESSQAHPTIRLDNVHHHLPSSLHPVTVPLQATAAKFRPRESVLSSGTGGGGGLQGDCL